MYIGIDVGSKHLDAAATAAAAALPRRVPNTSHGIARLVAALAALTPALIVLEATGTYHRPLLAALLKAALPVAVANPAQVVAFRQSRRVGTRRIAPTRCCWPASPNCTTVSCAAPPRTSRIWRGCARSLAIGTIWWRGAPGCAINDTPPSGPARTASWRGWATTWPSWRPGWPRSRPPLPP
jgi:hypothetical protein